MRWLAVYSSIALVFLGACQPATQPPAPTAPPAAAAPPTVAPTAAPPTVAPTPPPKPTAPPPTVAPTAAPTVAPATAPQAAQKLTIDVEADLDSLDPYVSYTPTGLSIHHNIYDYLLERDVKGALGPGLAESWKALNDTTLEFKLRRGVKFHSGEDVTADAVKFSVN